jgi:hypothetical protein
MKRHGYKSSRNCVSADSFYSRPVFLSFRSSVAPRSPTASHADSDPDCICLDRSGFNCSDRLRGVTVRHASIVGPQRFETNSTERRQFGIVRLPRVLLTVLIILNCNKVQMLDVKCLEETSFIILLSEHHVYRMVYLVFVPGNSRDGKSREIAKISRFKREISGFPGNFPGIPGISGLFIPSRFPGNFLPGNMETLGVL